MTSHKINHQLSGANAGELKHIMQTKFPDVSKAEWLAKVEKDLKGKPLESLNWEVEGEAYSPFWHAEDLPVPQPAIRQKKGWKIGVSIPFTSFSNSNRLALEALSGGANFLRFDYPGAMTNEEKASMLKDILLEIIDWEFFDIKQGGKSTYTRNDVTEFLQVLSTTPWENPRVWLKINDDYFTSIAFIRAVRLCIEQINTTLNLSSACEIGVIVEPETTDNADYHRISTTSQAMAAIIGGADILIIAPSNEKESSTFERRIARNIQHLLAEESYFSNVADPAAGSYFIEQLTDTIANKIWEEFQQINKPS